MDSEKLTPLDVLVRAQRNIRGLVEVYDKKGLIASICRDFYYLDDTNLAPRVPIVLTFPEQLVFVKKIEVCFRDPATDVIVERTVAEWKRGLRVCGGNLNLNWDWYWKDK